MGMSNFLADKLLNHTLRNTAYTSPTAGYLALFTTMPASDDSGGVEVVGGSYARKVLVFSAPASMSCYTTGLITFTGMPACVVVGTGIFDASTVGNLLFSYRFPSTVTVSSGTALTIPAGDVVAMMR